MKTVGIVLDQRHFSMWKEQQTILINGLSPSHLINGTHSCTVGSKSLTAFVLTTGMALISEVIDTAVL